MLQLRQAWRKSASIEAISASFRRFQATRDRPGRQRDHLTYRLPVATVFSTFRCPGPGSAGVNREYGRIGEVPAVAAPATVSAEACRLKPLGNPGKAGLPMKREPGNLP